ncbi:hypothetical protein [Comamonas sp. lk]|uniref:hypothetical protein n=1 Tax=Comamonas sp. lk TaxID=2201272 RepID=UPI000EAF0F8F|nr:hypothetical protein [Comamonas sp. lk]
MSLSYVNVHGKAISPSRMAAMRAEALEQERQKRVAAKADQVSAHKGWRVTGIPPEALSKAKEEHARLQVMARKAGGKPVEDFDEQAWLRKAKRSAVRSKPYSLQEAAQQCKELAMKAGWIDVQIQEIKKVVS